MACWSCWIFTLPLSLALPSTPRSAESLSIWMRWSLRAGSMDNTLGSGLGGAGHRSAAQVKRTAAVITIMNAVEYLKCLNKPTLYRPNADEPRRYYMDSL